MTRAESYAGPVIVATGGSAADGAALDWATSEAAARRTELRIVHAFSPELILAFCEVVPPLLRTAAMPEQARHFIHAAARRAQAVAPELTITTHTECGPVSSALLHEARTASLIVIPASARKRPLRTPRLHRQLRSTCPCPVVVVRLTNPGGCTTSTGRVVVGVGDGGKPTAALDAAFNAARQRTAGLTAVHAVSGVCISADDGVSRCLAFEDALQPYRDAFRDVDVQVKETTASPVRAILAEGEGAALLVVGLRRRRLLARAVGGAVAAKVSRLARGPVVVVPAPNRRSTVAGESIEQDAVGWYWW